MAELQRLIFRESVLSPWAGRLGTTRAQQPEGICPRFRTVGSLDAVNAQVGAQGLRPRALLPQLVVDTFSTATAAEDSRSHSPSSSDMPSKRRAAVQGAPRVPTRVQARKPRNEAQLPATTVTAEENPAAEEPETEATLIELATFPGFTPSGPTPLPHSLNTLDQMRRVTRAQAQLAAKREGYREYWRENFYSTASQTIFLDTFWWFFLERYQPHKAVQSSLFSRVAENYVTFLAKSEIHAWKDRSLKAYPDALAQCVYTAFIHAYPASWGSFDDNFKSALVEVIYLWQTGTRPMPELWRRWNFDYLDPPDSLKSIGQDDEPMHRKNTFDIDTLVEEARVSNSEETSSITGANLVDKERAGDYYSPPAAPSPSPQQKISRTELEEVLSGKTFEDEMHHFPQPDRGSVSILDVARSQYISLHQRKNESKKSLRQGNERGKTESDKRPVPTPTPPHAPRTLKKTTGNRSSQPPLQKEARGTTKPCTAEKTVHPRSNNSKKTTRETGKGPPDGGSSWKEKAITAREKARQRPMSILQQLHRHQGVPLAVPETESVCFNQFGRSPLVKHYLQKRQLSKVTGYAILTKRTELNQVIPSGAPTYEEVIQASLRESKKRAACLNSQMRQNKKQLQGILQERTRKRDLYKQQLRQLLSAQKEVESLSNELVAYWQQRGVDRKQGEASLKQTLSPDLQRTLSTCINQAFQRCSTHNST